MAFAFTVAFLHCSKNLETVNQQSGGASLSCFFLPLPTSCGTAVHKTHIFGHIMIEHRGTKRMTISVPNLNKEQKISSSKEKHAPNVRGAPRAAAA